MFTTLYGSSTVNQYSSSNLWYEISPETIIVFCKDGDQGLSDSHKVCQVVFGLVWRSPRRGRTFCLTVAHPSALVNVTGRFRAHYEKTSFPAWVRT